MEKEQIKPFIAKRAAQELHDGDVVNLGIGLPTLIPNFLPEGVHVILQSENGMIGMGPTPEEGKEDPWFINAGGGYITHVPGASTFDSATSFGISPESFLPIQIDYYRIHPSQPVPSRNPFAGGVPQLARHKLCSPQRRFVLHHRDVPVRTR
jgi:hypothetical protein